MIWLDSGIVTWIAGHFEKQMGGLMIYVIDELEVKLIACYFPCTHISFLVPSYVLL